MPKIEENLDILVAKVRALPKARQKAAIEALREITEEPYQLTDDELAVLRPALDEALRGEHLSDAVSDPLLNKPWA